MIRLVSLATLALLISCYGLTGTLQADLKPNILLICVDDLKPTLGCYGDPVAVTPNIDALAEQGVLFQRAYCNQAVCAPSRNALMTGLRPQSLGVYDLGTNFRRGAPDALTLGQFLQGHGYHAEGLGKIFHRGHGNTEDAATWSVPHWNSKVSAYQLPASTRNPKIDSRGKKRYAPTERAAVADDAYADGQTATEAIRRLRAAKNRPDRPFFMAVGFIRPHLPFVAPEKYWAMYDPNALPMPQVKTAPQGAPSFAPTGWGELRNYSGMPAKGGLADERTRHLIHGYYAATSYTDAQVGRVLEALRETGRAENTIVVFWGDHGWHLGDHGMWCKHTNYEQAARIPLIVSLPPSMSGTSGAKTSAMIETVDVYPTLAALAGFQLPQNIDGVDQSEVIKNPAATVRDHVIHVYPRGGRLGRAIRTPRYRLVQWKTIEALESEAAYELYDYQTDPLETANHFDQLPEVATQLKAILATHPNPLRQVRSQPARKSAKSK
jgi:iduronate 2-sulfatase